MAEYDPQPPFGGIAWREVDREALTPMLAAHAAELKATLAHRPDLLAAVLRPVETVTRQGAGRGATDKDRRP